MKIIKKTMSLVFGGILIGALVYLLILTNLQIVPSWFNTLSVLVFSGIFGLTGLVYTYSKLSLIFRTMLQVIILYLLVGMMVRLNNWLMFFEWFQVRNFFLFFIDIYHYLGNKLFDNSKAVK